MKKSIAFLGALLFGSVTFGQVTKNDSINKSTSRKVSAEDMKKFPEDIETTSTGGIKGESLEKHKGDESATIHKGGTYKKSIDQKSSDASAVAEKWEIAIEKVPGKGQKNSGTKSTATQKQNSTIKSNGSENETIKVSGTQSQNASSGNFLKIGDIKGEK